MTGFVFEIRISKFKMSLYNLIKYQKKPNTRQQILKVKAYHRSKERAALAEPSVKVSAALGNMGQFT